MGLIYLEMCSIFGTQGEKISVFTNLRKNNILPDEFKKSYPLESELISKMTSIDPTERPSTGFILKKCKIFRDMKSNYK